VHGHNAGHEDEGADKDGGRAHAETTLLILVELEDAGLLGGQLVGDGALLVGGAGTGGLAALSELVGAVIHGEEKVVVVLIKAR